ncbi:retrovirus-related pol polyprotein from transposon TNT 1-94 [Tanacetum coccineum]
MLITHQGNSQVKDNKIDLLVQQYEQFVISKDESIDSAFARFNTIITSLKALDEGYSSKNYVRKFLRALHPKWRANVTSIEESKDLTSLSLDELIGNLKVHEMIIKKDSKISDSGEEDDEKVKNEMCLVAQVSSEICLGVDLEPDEWIKDRGCSKHMTGNRNFFSSYKAYNGGNVIFGSNLRGNIIGKGQICDNKCRVTFSEHDSEITKDGKVMGKGIRKKGLYVIKLGNKPKDQIYLATIDENSTLWHRRLGHANMRLIQSLSSKELVRNLPKLKFDQHFCDAYKIGKQAHASHKAKNIVSTTRCLELLHMDLFGPSAVRSYGGNRYTLVIVDDYSRYTETRFLKDKTEAFDQFKIFSHSQNSKAYIILNKHTRKVEESLNVTFNEIPSPSKSSPLVDDDLDEEEAIKVTENKNLENDIEDETLEIDEIVNIKESRNHPLENGACVFTDRWSLDELAYGVPSEGPYQTNPPSPDAIVSFIRTDREGQVTRIRHEQKIDVQDHQIITHEIVSTLKPLEEIIQENTRKDRGTRRGRHSTSSSSAFDQPSSSHLNDDDDDDDNGDDYDDGNGEVTSRASTPSPIRCVNSLTNEVPQVFQNPPNIEPDMEPFYTRQTEIINRQVQIQDEHRG